MSLKTKKKWKFGKEPPVCKYNVYKRYFIENFAEFIYIIIDMLYISDKITVGSIREKFIDIDTQLFS